MLYKIIFTDLISPVVQQGCFQFSLYDTIRYRSLTWTRKLSIQLNLAHIARN